jgi:hypothetical protein
MQRHPAVRFFLALGALAYVANAAAQTQSPTLAQVAKREEERRKGIASPAKVLTNGDLKPTTVVSADAPASETAGGDATTPAATKAVAANKDQDKEKEKDKKDKAKEPAQDEKYWRDRIAAARAKLDHDKAVLDGLQSQVNFMNGQVLGQDDPVQKQQLSNKRFKVQHELDLLQKDIQDDNMALADIPEEARRAGVPAGWLR